MIINVQNNEVQKKIVSNWKYEVFSLNTWRWHKLITFYEARIKQWVESKPVVLLKQCLHLWPLHSLPSERYIHKPHQYKSIYNTIHLSYRILMISSNFAWFMYIITNKENLVWSILIIEFINFILKKNYKYQNTFQILMTCQQNYFNFQK